MPVHTAVFPEIVPGCAGKAATVTVSGCAVLLPHVLLAVTEMVPPADPAVAVIELVIELPVHPVGTDHIYEVAPLMAVTA